VGGNVKEPGLSVVFKQHGEAQLVASVHAGVFKVSKGTNGTMNRTIQNKLF
jgi:hypothetical protein